MQNANFDIGAINNITKSIIEEIGSSRQLILEIVDNIRKEQDELKQELQKIKTSINIVINDVDELEIKDKRMRKRLAEVSKNFIKYTESDIKTAYEEAAEVRIKFFEKKMQKKF